MFALGAIVSLCYVPGLNGAFIATQWSVLSILLPLLLLFRSGPVTMFHWAAALFLAYATVRLFYAPIFSDGVYGLWLVYIMVGSFWLGSTLDNLRGLYAGLAVGAAVSSAVAVSQMLGYSVVPYVTPNPAGLYVSSVAHGLVLALIVVALVSERIWLGVPLPLLGIALAGSRGAWLALAVGVASVYIRRAWVFGAVAAASTVFVTLSSSASDALRFYIWDTAVHNLTWLGWGPGSFFSWLLWYDSNTLYPEYAHNDALQFAFEYGIGALLPVGIFAFALTRTREREWPVIVAFATAGCYSMPAWVPVASFLAFVAAGRIVRSWAVVRIDSHNRRFDFVPWQHRTDRARGGIVPVVAGS